MFGRKLSRSRPAREALFSQLIRALILNGKIITTKAKVKAIQGQVEKFVTLAKKGDVNSRRQALADLDNAEDALGILFGKIAPVFSARKSGFTRLIALPSRKGDNAEMARLEWTEKIELEEKKKEKKAEKEKKTK